MNKKRVENRKNFIVFNLIVLILLLTFAINISAVDFVVHNTTNESQEYFVINGTTGNVNALYNVTASWFRGIFNWIVGSTSTNYLSFNGTWLDFNESKLNVTIGSIGNNTYILRTGDTATGNYTFDTNTFFIDSTNHRVGIGTTGPLTKLHLNVSDTSNTAIIDLITLDHVTTNTPGNGIGAGILFRAPDNNSQIENISKISAFLANVTNGSNKASALTFYTGVGNNTTGNIDLLERMRITGNGNVGIGTTSPAEKLSVNGNASVFGILDVKVNRVINVATPTDSNDAATKGYVDAQSANCQVQTFTSNGTWVRPSGVQIVWVSMVGAGGGGGGGGGSNSASRGGGGGGGGGGESFFKYPVSVSGNVSVTVGIGGSGGAGGTGSANSTNGTAGTASIFSSLTAREGGGGSGGANVSGGGQAGQGGSSGSGMSGGVGAPSSVNPGVSAFESGIRGSGGSGGSGQASNSQSSSSGGHASGGAGGSTATVTAGGGGGGASTFGSGASGSAVDGSAGASASANSGGGGGGSRGRTNAGDAGNGGSGGSGIVIVEWCE